MNYLKGLATMLLLTMSNAFMTIAWCGHLKFREMKWLQNLGLIVIILVSRGIALFEYLLQVTANRIGYKDYDGPFSLINSKLCKRLLPYLYLLFFPVHFSEVKL